jgi:hypothetical protein
MSGKLRKFALAAAALALVAGRADAAQVLQLKPVDGLVADGGATRLDFDRFDPTLGNLTGVRVELDLLSTGDSTTLGNHANQPKAFAYTLAQQAGLAAPGLALALAESRGVAGTLGAKGLGLFTAGGVPLGGTADATDLAGYLGTGALEMSLSTAQRFTLGGGPVFLGSRTPGSLGGTVALTYVYDGPTKAAPITPFSTPEPSTFVSAGIACVMGLGYGWRRRKARIVA